MKRINVKNIKVGEKYYFPDTDFTYPVLFKTRVRLERINKIIDGEFSTKNEGDRYEQQRFIGFKTKKEAVAYCIKEIKDRLKSINKEAKETIKSLSC